MSLDREQPQVEPVSSVEDLTSFFQKAERPTANHQVGLEHEKFIYPRTVALPVPYEGPSGIGALLTALALSFLIIFGLALRKAFAIIRPIFRQRAKINAEVPPFSRRIRLGTQQSSARWAASRVLAVFCLSPT